MGTKVTTPMPIYEYTCSKCHNNFEIIQKISEATKVDCPKCGHVAKRIISQTSFALKGGGWYKDGYGSAGKKTENRGQKTDSKAQTTEKKEIKKEEIKKTEIKKESKK